MPQDLRHFFLALSALGVEFIVMDEVKRPIPRAGDNHEAAPV
jgi:hypothetical protein